MTARLSPLQRQVLEQLAHIRVAPENAWMTTERLFVLVSGARDEDALYASIQRLLKRRLVEIDVDFSAMDWRWRITDKGREALR